MSVSCYLGLKCAVGFGVFLVTCPLAFLVAGLLGSLLSKEGEPVAFALTGIIYVFGSAVLTHSLTEKLSKRWSR